MTAINWNEFFDSHKTYTAPFNRDFHSLGAQIATRGAEHSTEPLSFKNEDFCTYPAHLLHQVAPDPDTPIRLEVHCKTLKDSFRARAYTLAANLVSAGRACAEIKFVDPRFMASSTAKPVLEVV